MLCIQSLAKSLCPVVRRGPLLTPSGVLSPHAPVGRLYRNSCRRLLHPLPAGLCVAECRSGPGRASEEKQRKGDRGLSGGSQSSSICLPPDTVRNAEPQAHSRPLNHYRF